MATDVINEVNSRLRFLYRQNKFLDILLRRLLCKAMIQPSLIMHVALGTLFLTKT